MLPAASDVVCLSPQGGHSEQQRKDALGSIQKLLGPAGSLELRAYVQVIRKSSITETGYFHRMCQRLWNVCICPKGERMEGNILPWWVQSCDCWCRLCMTWRMMVCDGFNHS
jgi:hypothetical protein